MAQSSSKRSKAQSALSDTQQLLARLEIEPARRVPAIENFVLFGKSVTTDEMKRNRSYYSQARHWFWDGVSSNAFDETTGGSSKPALNVSQQTCPCIKSRMSPYPVVIPFQHQGASVPLDILNDPIKLLEHHKVHWKQVRKHLIHPRRLYLQKFEPTMEFVESNRILPTDG